jgi:hypothetical protein
MDIVVNEELKAYIDPLTPDEYDALERSLLAEGCRDALVLWGDVLVDGHNRYGICRKHGLPFQTVQNPRFKSIEDVHLWMIDQHLGRRSVSDFQRGVLALRKREILERRRSERMAQPKQKTAPQAEGETAAAPLPEPAPLKKRSDVAKAARLSSSQVVAIEKIHTQAVPEVVAAVKSGDISLGTAAAVASLPADEQKAAALAGKAELKQAAKRVRDVKPRREPEPAEDTAAEAPWAADPAMPGDELATLRQRVAELTAENEALRREVAELQAQLV